MSFFAPHVTDETKFYSKLQKIRLVVLEVISTQISHRTFPAWLTICVTFLFLFFLFFFFLITFNLLFCCCVWRWRCAVPRWRLRGAGVGLRCVPARRGCSGGCSLLRFETVVEKRLAEHTASWEEPGARQKQAWEKTNLRFSCFVAWYSTLN